MIAQEFASQFNQTTAGMDAGIPLRLSIIKVTIWPDISESRIGSLSDIHKVCLSINPILVLFIH